MAETQAPVDSRLHQTAPRGPGRPREFDIADALDKAITVFSERGYHATSINDLTEATGLASGSVYKAFKDKKSVFLAAFDRYYASRSDMLAATLALAGTGRDKVRAALGVYADASYGDSGKCGCLIISTATELAAFDEDVASRVRVALSKREDLLAGLIEAGKQDGSISGATATKATATLLLCILQGMRLAGKTGRSRAEMEPLADLAMKVLD